MASTSDNNAAASAKDEAVDSTMNQSATPVAEATADQDDPKLDAFAAKQHQREETEATSSEALAHDVGKLEIEPQHSASEEAKASTMQSKAAQPTDDDEATENSAPEGRSEKLDSEESQSKELASADSKEVQAPTDLGNSVQQEALTSKLTTEALTASEFKQQDDVKDTDLAPQPSTTDTETSGQDPSSAEPSASASAPLTSTTAESADTKGESHAEGSAASTVQPSTSAAQKLGRADREALADPESVAAIAHAFGRDSPALRSSMDTPKRVTTPSELPNDTPQASQSSSDPEKQALKASDEAAASEAAQPSTSSPPAVAKSGAENDANNEKSASRSGGGLQIGKGPPPSTHASEELPFDFNRFLEQMKHRSAQAVGEYVRSFIKGFAKKPYRTQDQIKLIFDFLDFIAARMRECDIWKSQSDADFENAKEAMEKLIMNRLYPYTFTPALQKEGRWAVQTDDLERDRVLRQRILLFGWLSEEHLDVPVGNHSRGFIEFSIQELLKINHYKAPRDKLICILNCCKVIFGMIRHLSTQENADTFIPVLIFVVLKANPEHLISNVEYISRFRNPDRLSSESGYYLSSLMGAIAFIETMDYTSLSNITQEEFEKKVEEAVSHMEPSVAAASGAAGGSSLAPPTTPPPRTSLSPFGGNAEHQRSVSGQSVSAPSGPGEEAAKALPFTPMAATLADDTRAFFLRTGEAARTGLSRPMGALGRLINEGIEGIRTPSSSNNDSGMSTERPNSPAPNSRPGSSGLTASTSRSKLFGGLFGSLDTSDNAAQERARTAGYPGQQGQGQRGRGMLLDDEPQTPSTSDLLQDGFHAYPSGGAPNAPQHLLRPNMPQRGYSIDDTMYDDESAGRRNLMATSAHSGSGPRDADYYDDEESDSETRAPRNAAEAEQQRRRAQMQQDFGLHSTPSRRPNAAGEEQLQAGRRDEIAYENAQTEQAIQRSLMDQARLGAVEAAQNSASLETLKSIFPTMDEGVIGMVLHGCERNVETAIDRLLEMQ
ncbi:related to VPS9 (involved in vacuole trafficking) [Ustilago bromivora]|uniref:Related to VPS9 (Involved in vacuole trafficking) n=1 Tax=Ustilago bromivora TaxID=307758 RepID=A0A1K0GC27_9BASI|nr:related to VPS9 (involved in vacuole trafficking) [Ustilago bromivora]SYW76114.1 related to VPS9 (involved in vacuole trafficking) [Ustilago bromivora]